MSENRADEAIHDLTWGEVIRYSVIAIVVMVLLLAGYTGVMNSNGNDFSVNHSAGTATPMLVRSAVPNPTVILAVQPTAPPGRIPGLVGSSEGMNCLSTEPDGSCPAPK